MTFSRRAFLRGAGVCLALPYLESLAPRRARAQSTAPKRFIVTYFPNGAAAQYWPAKGEGQGNAWQLSPVLEPFAPLKSKMTVLTNLENYSPMDANLNVEPSHSRLCGAFLTCVDSDKIREQMRVEFANATSADQLIAQRMTTPLRSLEVGLSTLNSYEDGRHGSLSRSISWAGPTEPLYKEVNPQAVFDRLVASGASEGGVAADPEALREAQRRKALRLSVLDFVLDSARSIANKLGREDKPKLDQFLTSVRSLEERVRAVDATMGGGAMCSVTERHPYAYAVDNVPSGYNRGDHADVMNDLIVMALQCDVTRVVTHMLDDARSDFVYDHLIERQFNDNGSVQGNGGRVAGFHGLQHAGDSNNGYATINWWLSSKVADLCMKMDAIDEGDGTLLDNSIVLYGGSMRGSDHKANKLPFLYLGKGGGVFKTDMHVKFPDTPSDRPLRDLYYTIMNAYFGLGIDKFGDSVHGTPNALIEEILA